MRLPSLDSVRGIAALIVVFYHASLVLPMPLPWWVTYTPLRLFVAGPAAVLVFFVLSGIVLAMTFVYRDGERYLPYAAKRILRIWLPFAAAIALSIALKITVGGLPAPAASEWFHYTWDGPLSWQSVANHLLMTGTSIDLDNPMWSLCHEIRISLIFPLLVLATRKRWKLSLALSIAIVAVAIKAQTLLTPGILREQLSTLTYVFLFTAGITLALHVRDLRKKIEAQSAGVRTALWVLCFGLLAVAPHSTSSVDHLKMMPLLVAAGIGAAGISLLSIAEGRAMTMLLGIVPTHLGRISYSLYLVHVPILAAMVRLLTPAAGLVGAVGIGIVAAIIVADGFCRAIERPAMNYGRRLASRLAG